MPMKRRNFEALMRAIADMDAWVMRINLVRRVPVHWHELPEFVRARARDKGIDVGGDGHRHRLVTRRDAQGGVVGA